MRKAGPGFLIPGHSYFAEVGEPREILTAEEVGCGQVKGRGGARCAGMRGWFRQESDGKKRFEKTGRDGLLAPSRGRGDRGLEGYAGSEAAGGFLTDGWRWKKQRAAAIREKDLRPVLGAPRRPVVCIWHVRMQEFEMAEDLRGKKR